MNVRQCKIVVLSVALAAACVLFPSRSSAADGPPNTLDAKLTAALAYFGFTGRVGSTLEQRLGRPVDRGLADLGRKLFHDTVVGLNGDNSCSGCHSATAGFGASLRQPAVHVRTATTEAASRAKPATRTAGRRVPGAWVMARTYHFMERKERAGETSS